MPYSMYIYNYISYIYIDIYIHIYLCRIGDVGLPWLLFCTWIMRFPLSSSQPRTPEAVSAPSPGKLRGRCGQTRCHFPMVGHGLELALMNFRLTSRLATTQDEAMATLSVEKSHCSQYHMISYDIWYHIISFRSSEKQIRKPRRSCRFDA